MKFSCEKLVLQNAIATAARAVATKSSIPALEGLLLQCSSGSLTVTGYNMQLGIRTELACDVEKEGQLVLSARLFGDIIRRMPDDTVTLTADDKLTVKVSCGDADFDIIGRRRIFRSCPRWRKKTRSPCRKKRCASSFSRRALPFRRMRRGRYIWGRCLK